MAENTKNPPQDPRPRTAPGDPARPQNPGSVANPNKRPDSGAGLDETRPEIANPAKPSRIDEGIDEDRDRQGVGRKTPGSGKAGRDDGVVDLDEIDTDERITQRLDRQ